MSPTPPGGPGPIDEVAAGLGIDPAHVVPAGRGHLRIEPSAVGEPAGNHVLVTAISPTRAGEGKTVTTLGLGMGLARLGLRSAVTLRQSSFGPTFGMKGGGVGGGRARVVPFDEALLGLGGDLFAVEMANNLLAARLDDALAWDLIGLDPLTVQWPRVTDVNDRSLRHVVTGLGGRGNGRPREAAFQGVAASEVMAVLALARDLDDLAQRLARIVVGFGADGVPVTAEDLGVAGAMAVLVATAAAPHLLQTEEGTAAFLHAGPFANVGPGVCSVISDRVALTHAQWVVTEAGFAADLGAEKYFHLKAPKVGVGPSVVVLVATVRAIDERGRHHGLANLERHVANTVRFGAPVVVTLNRFGDETAEDLAAVAATAESAGAACTVSHSAFADGGIGAVELAEAVVSAGQRGPATITPAYAIDDPFRTKVEALATGIYGADAVSWSTTAVANLERFEAAGFGHLPPCVAKTHRSFSHDPELPGAPTGYTFPVDTVELAAGAGYLRIRTGTIHTLPGLPRRPRALDIDLGPDGQPVGLV